MEVWLVKLVWAFLIRLYWLSNITPVTLNRPSKQTQHSCFTPLSLFPRLLSWLAAPLITMSSPLRKHDRTLGQSLMFIIEDSLKGPEEFCLIRQWLKLRKAPLNHFFLLKKRWQMCVRFTLVSTAGWNPQGHLHVLQGRYWTSNEISFMRSYFWNTDSGLPLFVSGGLLSFLLLYAGRNPGQKGRRNQEKW